MSIKTFVIAGGSTGVGKRVVLELVKLGHNVVFGDISTLESVEGFLGELKQYDGKAYFLHTDLRIVKHCERLFKFAHTTCGPISGFFSYAGITPAETLLECTEEVHDEIFNINLKGAIFCSKYAIKYMKDTGGGSIVFTGSPHAWGGEYDRVSYACSKGAIITLSEHISKNYGKFNIRANYITLGWTPTEGELFLRKHQGTTEEALRKMASEIVPMGRMNEYEDIVPAVLFLLCDNSLLVSGSNIRITGGWYM
jgi:NAD(P)-dependent dehydrogenase (short-subunit alcohol dehydrogenase family)